MKNELTLIYNLSAAYVIAWTKSLMQWRLVRVGKAGAAYPDFAKDINLFKLKFINRQI
jgi:hypothetical protein